MHSKIDFKRLAISILKAGFWVYLAYAIAIMINKNFPLSKWCVAQIQNLSIIFIAVPFYYARGWEIQAWDGNSDAENCDKRIISYLQWLGFIFAVGSFHLIGSSTSKEFLSYLG